MRVFIDFESRSACDLKKHGAFVYSEDPTTGILCLAYKVEGETIPSLWRPGMDEKPMLAVIAQADEIWAHNMSFETALWANICVKRYGWPPLHPEKLRCSAAKVSMHALPRALGQAGTALGLPMQKDREGYALMLRMCKPRKPKKGEPEGMYWYESHEDIERLRRYCIQDVIVEEALSNALRDLPDQELQIWRLDQTINERGIQVDLGGAKAMKAMVKEHELILLDRLQELTYGAVQTAKQVEVLRKYLLGLGCDLPDLTVATVKKALDGELSDEVREILEIRKSLGRSSSAKYQAVLDRASYDGRVRGLFIYHGASTGRWVSGGLQVQNLPSRIKISDDPETMLDVVKRGGLELFTALYDDDVMSAAGAIVRSVLMAAPGKDLIVCDFSSIEARGLAWLAGEETELDIYRAGKDPYIAAAASIFYKPYEAITKEERATGKTAVLACGYQGSVNAVRKFGGEDMTDDEIKDGIVRPWRDAHPMTVKFWYGLEEACMNVVREPGRVFNYRAVSYKVQDKFLMCRLPSGRLLFYYHPLILPVVTSWGETKDAVTYMTVDVTKHWARTNTYGGKMTENVCQSICRDLMAQAMLRLEAAGYPIVMTIHDEIVAEVAEDFGSVEEFEKIMCVVPLWAKGFPIKASGWRGRRYRK